LIMFPYTTFDYNSGKLLSEVFPGKGYFLVFSLNGKKI
jgi:hypothetical protein